MPAPKAISFRSPDVMALEWDDNDNETVSKKMIEPCKNYANYSSWLKDKFLYLVNKKNIDFNNNVLEIYDIESLLEFYYYQPKQ